MAGGVRLLLENLDAFRRRVNAFARPRLTEEMLTPALKVEAEITLAECNARMMTLVEQLEPFGMANPRPRFLLRGVQVTAPPRRVGATGSHLQMTVARAPHVARCIAWRMGELESQLPVGTVVDLVVAPQLEVWEGRVRVDLSVVDVAFATPC